MNKERLYDVVIAGGGLAGLSGAIQLAAKNFRVALIEKERYPFHKVCGEYISLESYTFLEQLGLQLSLKNLPVITELLLSGTSGKTLHHRLPLGGFGISRYEIDSELAAIAKKTGVAVFDGRRVQDIRYNNDHFNIETDDGEFYARHVCGAFGKRSNLDVKWKRPFVQQRPNALNNFIAVKYHVRMEHPRDTIALHNFRDGYCGISPIENGNSCVCYLTTAGNLQQSGNNIAEMEETILMKNPLLQEALNPAIRLYEKPLAIAQISFDKKEKVREHVLFAGDAAGLITPLCGNGMSMALGGSRIAAALISEQLEGKISREQMEKKYAARWQAAFGNRLWAGRIIQGIFGKEWLTDIAFGSLRHFPGLLTRIIRQTHG